MGKASRTKRARRVARSRPDLLTALREQFRFLVRSSTHYDEGDVAEAKNLAVHLRKLLYDSGRSVSVLTQLGERDRVQYIDTAPGADPSNMMPMSGLAGWQILPDECGARWLATLDQQPEDRTGRMSPFATWWRGKVSKDGQGELWSREDLVLGVAHEDGGAHVDPGLTERYHRLSRENGMGWRFHAAGTDDNGVPMLGNPVLASVRQIAWELEWTLRVFLWRELGFDGPQAHRFRPPDPEPDDERVLNRDLERLPSVSFSTTVTHDARTFFRIENRRRTLATVSIATVADTE